MTVQWILECFRKGYLIPEEQYAPASYQQVNIPSSELPFTSKKNMLKKEHVNTVAAADTDDELLSQYVTHDSKVGKVLSCDGESMACVPEVAWRAMLPGTCGIAHLFSGACMCTGQLDFWLLEHMHTPRLAGLYACGRTRNQKISWSSHMHVPQ